uniref:Putative secreted protein n=1 Tax=Anopheles marajoara TaxID=58244 RepID=A0A2M4CG09_9DIPT
MLWLLLLLPGRLGACCLFSVSTATGHYCGLRYQHRPVADTRLTRLCGLVRFRPIRCCRKQRTGHFTKG